MALIITFQNVNQKGEIADYVYQVYVNKKIIAGGRLPGHNRETGWEGLVKDFAQHLQKGKQIKGKKLPENWNE